APHLFEHVFVRLSTTLHLSSKVQGGSDTQPGRRARGGTSTLARVPGAALLRELSRTEFRADLHNLLAVYAAAMRPEPAQLPGRLAIMERHAASPAFRCIAATAESGPEIIGFAYGFRGVPGQWWHDVVSSGVTVASSPAAATAWLADALEIAEVHVRP